MLHITREPLVVKAPEKQERHLKPEAFAFIDKNLPNNPFGRNARVKLDWQENEQTGWQWVDLPRTRIRLRLRAAAKKRRHPTGLDQALSYTLIAETRKQKQLTIVFQSVSSIVKLLGLVYDKDNLRRVKASLTLLSKLSIRIKRYYFAARRLSRKQYQKARHGPKLFHSPISKLDFDGRQVTITLNEEWCQQKQGFMLCVPLPLPTETTAQNAVLAILAFPNAKRTVLEFCRKIGLNHNNKRSVLPNVLKTVQAYFKRMVGP